MTTALEFAEEIGRYSASLVCDVARQPRILDSGIQPLQRPVKLCGPVYTAAMARGDNLALHRAIAHAPPGSVLVASGGAPGLAVWGSLMTAAAVMRGLRGLVVDGWVRDGVDVRDPGFDLDGGYTAQ